MILDIGEFDDGAAVAADVCVMRCGAAGMTIAREFVCTRFTVLVAEAGGLQAEAETQKLRSHAASHQDRENG